MTQPWERAWGDASPVAPSFDDALKAEGVTGQLADVARSIYAQESSSGKNTQTSNAGAVGGMQIIPSTFASVADQGWDINNGEHNMRAGIRYVRQMHERAGGDPALTAAGYYGGPGGMAKARKGVAVSDPRNPNAPTTLEYGQQVAARLPGQRSPIMRGIEAMTNAIVPSAAAAEAPPRAKNPWELDWAEPAGAPAAEPVPEEPSGLQRFAHGVGVGARGLVTGLTSIPGIVSDAITGPINAGLDKIQGEGQGARFQTVRSATNNLLDAAGVPDAQNGFQRIARDVTDGAASGVAFAGAGGALSRAAGMITQSVGKIMAAGPGLQAASGAAGAGASSATRESGGSETAQVIAGLAGGMVPSMLPYAGQSAVRGALRGGEAGRQRVADNIALFEGAGMTPTLGQATEGRLQRGTESLLGRAPGGAGVVAKAGERQAERMAEAVKQLSDDLAPGANAMTAGESIAKGVSGFKSGMQQVQTKLYNELDKHIPSLAPIPSARTQAALRELNADIAGAPELSKWFKNARIQGIEGALSKDVDGVAAILSRPGMQAQASALEKQLTQEAAEAAARNAERRALTVTSNPEPVKSAQEIADDVTKFLQSHVDGDLPYASVKKLRTLVGRELADGGLMADVPRSKWSALYSALSDDLGDAATAAGPAAAERWAWANQFTKSQLNRLEELQGIVGRDAPEKIFSAAVAGSAEGNTIVQRVFSALPKQNRREVAAAVLQRLGRATAGNQNAEADAFSSETFLSNLAKLSPAARKTIFGRLDVDGLEKRIAGFAKIAESRREGGKVFANPSGTAAAAAQLTAAGGLVGALASGNPLAIAAAIGLPVAAHVIAKGVTNPALVRGLAMKTVTPHGTGAAATGAAARSGNSAPPAVEPPEVNVDPWLRDWGPVPVESPPPEDPAQEPANMTAPAESPAPEVVQPVSEEPTAEITQDLQPVELPSPEQVTPVAAQGVDELPQAAAERPPVQEDGAAVAAEPPAAPTSPSERLRARALAERGVQAGDLLNSRQMPFTVKLPAIRAAKEAGEGFEVVPVRGGYVVRRGLLA